MTYLKILNHSQKKEFESPPSISDETRKELFTLHHSMQLQLASFDKDVNKLHFIAMYGYFKVYRTFFDAVSFPKSDIDYIVNQYNFHLDTLKIALNTQVRYKRIIR